MAFFNIYAARLWHDLHDSRVFIDYLRDKITRKLLKVKVKTTCIFGVYRSNFFPLSIWIPNKLGRIGIINWFDSLYWIIFYVSKIWINSKNCHFDQWKVKLELILLINLKLIFERLESVPTDLKYWRYIWLGLISYKLTTNVSVTYYRIPTIPVNTTYNNFIG